MKATWRWTEKHGKTMHFIPDAAEIGGSGCLLTQSHKDEKGVGREVFVFCWITDLKQCQKMYSMFENQMMAMVFPLEQSSAYAVGVPQIEVFRPPGL